MNLIKKYFCLLPLLLTCCLIPASYALAKTTVSDGAQLLTIEEIESITERCDTILERYNTSVYVITTDSFDKTSDCRAYADRIGKKDNAPENLVILLVSTKKDSFLCQVTCFGTAKSYLTEKRCRRLEKNVVKHLEHKEYFDAFYEFTNKLSSALERNPRLDAIPFRSTVQLLFSLLLSAGILLCILRTNTCRRAGRTGTYLDRKHSRLLGHLDHLQDITLSGK